MCPGSQRWVGIHQKEVRAIQQGEIVACGTAWKHESTCIVWEKRNDNVKSIWDREQQEVVLEGFVRD